MTKTSNTFYCMKDKSGKEKLKLKLLYINISYIIIYIISPNTPMQSLVMS